MITLATTDYHDSAISPERRLMLGVIVNAALDASGRSREIDRQGSRARLQDDALAWFRDGGDDFRFVCALAGLSPEIVSARVIDYVARVATDPSAAVDIRFLRGGKYGGATRRHAVHNQPSMQ